MKPYLAWALVASIAALLNAGDRRSEALVVHEWGTFTSVAGEDGAAVDWDVLGGTDDLPRFVNDRGFRCFKFRLAGTVRMETPVLYFYSPQPLNARVRVAFPKGLITEWYPQAEYQVDQQSGADGSVYRLEASLCGIDTSMMGLTGGIEWKNVKIEPNATPVLPLENNPSHYYAARATDAAPITVGAQQEKFLFYRGVGRIPVPLSARLSAGGTVLVTNLGPHPVPMVTLFENRAGRVGYRIAAGALSGAIALDRPSLDGGLSQLHIALENALIEHGLFPKEAHAMLDTWRDSWFEEGLRLIYIVPRPAVDAILPLQVDPAPSQTARVFVGRIELITPEMTRAVEAALASNDRSALARYGRFLDPILKRTSLQNPAMASQAEQIRTSVQRSFAAAACR